MDFSTEEHATKILNWGIRNAVISINIYFF